MRATVCGVCESASAAGHADTKRDARGAGTDGVVVVVVVVVDVVAVVVDVVVVSAAGVNALKEDGDSGTPRTE